MNYLAFQKSISNELIATKDRVRNIIENRHWGEEGRYKEVILIESLKKRLPKNICVGTGFIINQHLISTQIDIILYRNEIPIILQQGDFVIVPSDAVMGVIEVKHLTKDYGSGRGVFDVSFEVNQGEVFGFLGPNGAGKSTTIRHLMGFSKPQSGSTLIFGKETFDKYFEILNKVGYIPGEIALPAGLTGWEFIRMMQNLQKSKNEEHLQYLLKLFELDPSGETKRMSLGVKRKLAVVTAFMSDPDVLILDEPTSGLDPVMQEKFIEFIKNEKERGKTILLSSHIFSEVDATCDKIAIIKDGKLVSVFNADNLKHKTQKNYKVEFDTKETFDRFLKKSYNIIDFNKENNTAIISTDDSMINGVISQLSNFEMTDFTHLKETLEDYFMTYYKEEKDFGGALK